MTARARTARDASRRPQHGGERGPLRPGGRGRSAQRSAGGGGAAPSTQGVAGGGAPRSRNRRSNYSKSRAAAGRERPILWEDRIQVGGGRALTRALTEALKPLALSKSLGACGTSMIPDEAQEAIGVVKVTEFGKGCAGFVGVRRCKSPHSCLNCASSIAVERAKEIDYGKAAHEAKYGEGSVLMFTYTVAHEKGDDLGMLLVGLAASWKAHQTHRDWRAFEGNGDELDRVSVQRCPGGGPGPLITQREAWWRPTADLKIVATVRALDPTYSGFNGWHPHYHVLYFFNRPPTDEELETVRALAARLWEQGVVSKMGEKHRPSAERGVVVTRSPEGSSVGSYLTKSGNIGAEVTDAGKAKRGNGGSLTPFEIAARAADGRSGYVLLWQQYQRAMKGKRAVVGLEKLVRLYPMPVEEHSDEEGRGDIAEHNKWEWEHCLCAGSYAVRVDASDLELLQWWDARSGLDVVLRSGIQVGDLVRLAELDLVEAGGDEAHVRILVDHAVDRMCTKYDMRGPRGPLLRPDTWSEPLFLETGIRLSYRTSGSSRRSSGS